MLEYISEINNDVEHLPKERRLYPHELFRDARRWANLPDPQGNPSPYFQCLPLMTGFQSNQGFLSKRIGFK